MSVKPVVLRDGASVDVDQAVAHYLEAAPESVAAAFIDALEEAYQHIGQLPSTGSPRIGQQQSLPGLRSWSIRGFPYLAFYVEEEDYIDLWRVLHAARDIQASLTEETED